MPRYKDMLTPDTMQRWRREQGLSTSDLAFLLGVRPSLITRLEDHVVHMSPELEDELHKAQLECARVQSHVARDTRTLRARVAHAFNLVIDAGVERPNDRLTRDYIRRAARPLSKFIAYLDLQITAAELAELLTELETGHDSKDYTRDRFDVRKEMTGKFMEVLRHAEYL